MLMNDPSREYYRLYEIDFDRHAYDGRNWTYVNLPVEDIKENGYRVNQRQHDDVFHATWASSSTVNAERRH